MPIKVMVVDDSALMRKHLRAIFEDGIGFEVVTARDGQNALDLIPQENPDVITLDINMPVMDGLTCLSHIMEKFPRPVVMVSSLTEKGAVATFEALELGAVDYVSKPGGTVSLNIKDVSKEIRDKTRVAAGVKTGKAKDLVRRIRAQRQVALEQPVRKARPTTTYKPNNKYEGVVLIGSSTGGPAVVELLLQDLPGDFPLPILIAQHMPPKFTAVFAKRLNDCTDLVVEEVDGPIPLEPGKALIGRGGSDLTLGQRGHKLVALSSPEDSSPWHPSVSRMVKSAMVYVQPEKIICVQLTGMGNDGAHAMSEVFHQGGRTVAQSEKSSAVFGMPKELICLNAATEILDAENIVKKLVEWTR